MPAKAPLSKTLLRGEEMVGQKKHICDTHAHSMDGKRRKAYLERQPWVLT